MNIGTRKGETRSGALLEERLELLLERGQAAHARADHDANFIGALGDVEAGLLEGLATGGDRHLHEAVHAARFLAVDVVERVEVGHLARDLRVEVGDIAERDRANAVLVREQGLPGPLAADADGGDHADPRHDHAPRSVRLHHGPSQRPKTTEELCPPRPTDVLIAYRTVARRASLGT